MKYYLHKCNNKKLIIYKYKSLNGFNVCIFAFGMTF